MSELNFRVRLADWARDGHTLESIRRQVFVLEQQVPEELEWDGQDVQSVHVMAETLNGAPIGTARMLPDGHIGRMAVLKPWRGQGVGRQLLDALINMAQRRGCTSVYLHAQSHALAFYEKSGFAVYGVEFTEADIPHRRMKRILTTPTDS
jgi:predicted GNAT family N-acyltransferase